MKSKLSLLLVIIFLLTGPGSVFASSAIIDAINNLEKSGKVCNIYLDHSVVDLTYVSEGSVTTTTYVYNKKETINNFTVEPQKNNSATTKITSFIFELTNQYRPETELALSVSGDKNTVHAYTYGTYKDEAMYAILSGLTDCLGHESVHLDDDSDSWTSSYSPEEMTKETFTSFKIGEEEYTVTSETTETTKTMDVAPEIKNDRTFTPVRYVAYSLGATNDDIEWNNETKTATIIQEDTKLSMTVDDDSLVIGDDVKKMDVAPYIKEGRTMLPARWVAEPLGAGVEWDAEKKQTVIKITEQGQ